MLIRLLAAGLAVLAFSPVAISHHDENHGAQEKQISIGPVIGAQAPALTAIAPDGTSASLEALSGTSGTIISFVRSADWCPFCKRQLIELNAAEADISASGWNIVGLSYDTPEKLAAFTAKSSIGFPLLADTDSVTIKAFGLLNEEVAENSRSYGIPHPALVFIGSDGTVMAVLREEGYRKRPSLEVIKETITKLSVAE